MDTKLPKFKIYTYNNMVLEEVCKTSVKQNTIGKIILSNGFNGWSKENNPSLFPSNYVGSSDDRFWAFNYNEADIIQLEPYIHNASRRVAFHCSTLEESFAVNRIIESYGGRNLHDKWSEYKSQTCYSPRGCINSNNTFCRKGYYQAKGHEIIEATDLFRLIRFKPIDSTQEDTELFYEIC